MKVNIGNYPNRLTCNIHRDHMNKKYGHFDWKYGDDTGFYEETLEKLEELIQTYIYDPLNRIYFDKRKQKIKVRIDPWDTWSMDHTLAYIIVPMLKQLKETKQGSPYVDKKDIPKEFHLTRKEQKLFDAGEANEDIEAKFFAQWDWIIDEMIWAFEQQLTDWESHYESGEHDITWVPRDDDETIGELVVGPNDTYQVDRAGKVAHNARMENGYILFGKYYQNLWD